MSRNIDWWENFWQQHPDGYGSPRESLLNFAQDFLLHHPHATAIDIASGDGRYALPLAKIGYQVDATEYTQSGVDLIKKRALQSGMQVHVFQNDFTKETFHKKQYDLVFCSGLLEEIDSRYHVSSIKKFMRWTKPGGLNIIKYCVWIHGRGDLVQRELGITLYKEAGWKIVYHQGADITENAKKNARFDEAIQSQVKTETIVALNE
jgi:ubiquinone/menaquinone biosynthesis C-methylase UbiE